MILYQLPLLHSFTSGFRSGDVAVVGCQFLSANQNFVVVTQSAAKIWIFLVWKKNVRHIEILLPVLIWSISPQSACHSAPVCQIIRYSKSAQKSAVQVC